MSSLALAGTIPAGALRAATGGYLTALVEPVPLDKVRLAPSIFADAQAANRSYLASLDPERLLHNFYLSAGLEPPAPVYGGWEAMGIAGHSLGHWLSAVSLLVANTGDVELAANLDHALAQMAQIQSAHGDGYIGGTTVERDGEIVDGKIVFEEVRRGDIRSGGFDLNGGWVPLYTWHKIHAGLIDAYRLARRQSAMPILLGMSTYLAEVLEPLDDEQMQRVLHAEHGGLNESYADTFALTGNRRWLRLARRIYHRAVLDPLVAQEDRLEGLHANTQIPKVIGLARLHEVAPDARYAGAAQFFHKRVTQHHSYVIGGNSEREHFGPPDQRAHRIGEATCEACNTYNMLKLTRHLYSWQPDARWFDFYEQAQINHIMAHQRPDNGRFVYFMPLAAGARRIYSDPEDSFWCCVGSGMESHAKHADSIWWHDAAACTLFVNLFIPSSLDWPERELGWRMASAMPDEGSVRLSVSRPSLRATTLAMRIPAWSAAPQIAVNGVPVETEMADGYSRITRPWDVGDTVDLTLPMTLGVERVPDDPSILAFTRGPLILAADLGPADEDFVGTGPVLVAGQGNPAAALRSASKSGVFTTEGGLGETLFLKPFFRQYDRRSAVYFPTFTSAEWAARRGEYIRSQEAAQALSRRTVDTLYLGEMQPERDHDFVPGRSEVVNWNGRAARRLPPGDEMRMTLARRPGDAVLQVTVFSADAARPFGITVDGAPLELAWPEPSPGDGFVTLSFSLPPVGEQGRAEAVIGVRALREHALLYEVRMMEPEG
ncbi:glycoside hydrolase family 127 protein [Aurantiacibacter luteus]|uniref:glycoside hydrolase family 127 protein n=1 Tax=Aurantiacibacter luteus TaxID=1581420 RepID=UPI00138E2B55|nr:glycoside hydrolase family 127 protein [Aurantiacibacter luteus]